VAAAKYWLAFGFLALVPMGYRLGGSWTFLLVGALPLALLVGDEWLGDESVLPPDASPYRLLPWLYIPAQLAVTAWAGWIVARPATSMLEAIGLTLSTGVAAGVFGFLAAHEMVHSRHSGERALGVLMLAGMLDMPFAISHIQGHHRRAATLEDPTTARRGESVYAFIVRSLAGQAREAWTFETRRLVRGGRSRFGLGNRMIVYAATEIGLTLAISALGWRALAFFLAQAALAICLLEGFNYIAHYGLVRRTAPDGRPEPLRPRHSWNTRKRTNNATLFNMGRHADHHRFSARPYHELEALEGAAELPCGYAGVLLLAFAPPLFRRVMDPRADAVMGISSPLAPLRQDAA
jgi:alkane 1-monooxygenase